MRRRANGSARLVKANVVRARQLHAEDFQLINPLKGELSKKQYLEAIGSGELDYLFWEPASIAVRLYRQAASSATPSHLEIMVQGRHVPRQRYWHTDLSNDEMGSGRSRGRRRRDPVTHRPRGSHPTQLYAARLDGCHRRVVA